MKTTTIIFPPMKKNNIFPLHSTLASMLLWIAEMMKGIVLVSAQWVGRIEIKFHDNKVDVFGRLRPEQPISISSCLILLLGWGGRMSWAEESWHKKESRTESTTGARESTMCLFLLCATLAAFYFPFHLHIKRYDYKERKHLSSSQTIFLCSVLLRLLHTLCSALCCHCWQQFFGFVTEGEFFATLRRLRQCSLSSNSSF